MVLAGGAGRRFGGGKLLAPLAGAPVIRRTAEAVAASGFGDMLVITGADHAAITAALEGVACRTLHAAGWEEGMAASLRTGIAALPPEVSGVALFLGDMPLVPVHMCGDLVGLAEASGYAARPRVSGKPGHPVCFTRAAFADLMRLEGDSGATGLLRHRETGVAYLETEAMEAMLDIDSPADLVAAERAWKACATSATSDSAMSRGDLPKP